MNAFNDAAGGRPPGTETAWADEATDSIPPASTALMSTQDVAKLFGRSARTIRSWIQRGLLRPVRIGRAVFFRTADIEELLGYPADRRPL